MQRRVLNTTSSEEESYLHHYPFYIYTEVSMTRLGFYSAFVAAVFALVMVASPASAHTVQIKWSDNGGGSYTFYAGTYHLPGSSSGYGNSGGLIVNGTTYWFTSVVSSPPSAAMYGQHSPCYSGLPIFGWQVVTVTDSISVRRYPSPPLPPLHTRHPGPARVLPLPPASTPRHP